MAVALGVSNALPGRVFGLLAVAIVAIAPVAIGQTAASKADGSPAHKVGSPAPTVAEAERFISQAETRLLDLWIKSGRASWVAENFITGDTEAISATSKRP